MASATKHDQSAHGRRSATGRALILGVLLLATATAAHAQNAATQFELMPMRLRPGDYIVVLDPQGADIWGRVVRATTDALTLAVGTRTQSRTTLPSGSNERAIDPADIAAILRSNEGGTAGGALFVAPGFRVRKGVLEVVYSTHFDRLSTRLSSGDYAIVFGPDGSSTWGRISAITPTALTLAVGVRGRTIVMPAAPRSATFEAAAVAGVTRSSVDGQVGDVLFARRGYAVRNGMLETDLAGRPIATTFEALRSLLTIGGRVVVTTIDGHRYSGRVSSITEQGLTLGGAPGATSARVVSIPASQLERAERPAGARHVGLFSGMGLGALLMALPIATSGSVESLDAAGYLAAFGLGAGIGAGVGAAIDAARPHDATTLFVRPGAGNATRLLVRPMLLGERKGVSVAVRF